MSARPGRYMMDYPLTLTHFFERTRRLFADHLTAEYRVKTEGRGRTVDERKLRTAGGGDNRWCDGLVTCAVAASMQGAVLEGTGGNLAGHRRRQQDPAADA